MAVDMFLTIGKGATSPEVKGEAQDETYGGTIDVLSWSWGVSNSGTTHMGSGSGAGRANFQDLSVTSWYDTASHEIAKACGKGKHFEKIFLICRKAGDKPMDYITYELTDCIITSFSTGGSGGEDRLTANFSINFGAFKISYQAQDKKGGKDGAAIDFAYDIAAQKDL